MSLPSFQLLYVTLKERAVVGLKLQTQMILTG